MPLFYPPSAELAKKWQAVEMLPAPKRGTTLGPLFAPPSLERVVLRYAREAEVVSLCNKISSPIVQKKAGNLSMCLPEKDDLPRDGPYLARRFGLRRCARRSLASGRGVRPP